MGMVPRTEDSLDTKPLVPLDITRSAALGCDNLLQNECLVIYANLPILMISCSKGLSPVDRREIII